MWQVFAETQAVDSTVVRTRAEGLRWLDARGAGDPELGDPELAEEPGVS